MRGIEPEVLRSTPQTLHPWAPAPAIRLVQSWIELPRRNIHMQIIQI